MSYCDWDTTDELCLRYHDEEWGVPLHDDRGQFEFLSLEVMQCGLNWTMMLHKREVFRACFAGFDFDAVAAFGPEDVERILEAPGMIRSRRKVEAIINNARCFQRVREEFGSFDAYLWGFSDGKTILYNKHEDGWIPVSNGLSARIAADLRRRGFKYLGPTTVYSHLQACGIINDHGRDCPRHAVVNALSPTAEKRRHLEKGVHHSCICAVRFSSFPSRSSVGTSSSTARRATRGRLCSTT